MQLSTRSEGQYFVVTVSRRLDAVTTPEFESACTGWLDEGQCRLILDMSEMEYISSAGLRSILSAAKRAQRMGGGLSLVGLAGQVLEVIQLSGFDRILPIYPTVADAPSAT